MICRRASSPLVSRFLVSSRLSNSIPSCNFVDKIDNEIASYSNEVVPVPNGLPFKLYAPLGKDKSLNMQQRHRNEDIKVHVLDRLKYQVNGDPFISLFARVVNRRFKVMSNITAKPGRINIHDVTIRNVKEDCSGEFVEYFKSKGITSKTISVLCGRLGIKLNNASATPGNSALELDGPPFDSIGEDHGGLVLVRETEDEIVRVHVHDANDFGFRGEAPEDCHYKKLSHL